MKLTTAAFVLLALCACSVLGAKQVHRLPRTPQSSTSSPGSTTTSPGSTTATTTTAAGSTSTGTSYVGSQTPLQKVTTMAFAVKNGLGVDLLYNKKYTNLYSGTYVQKPPHAIPAYGEGFDVGWSILEDPETEEINGTMFYTSTVDFGVLFAYLALPGELIVETETFDGVHVEFFEAFIGNTVYYEIDVMLPGSSTTGGATATAGTTGGSYTSTPPTYSPTSYKTMTTGHSGAAKLGGGGRMPGKN